MLKGTCRKCGKPMQWSEPVVGNVKDLYTVQCPHCKSRQIVEDAGVIPNVEAEPVPKEIKYQVFYIRPPMNHVACYNGDALPYESAKKNVETGNELNPGLTYYMKPVLDGLA